MLREMVDLLRGQVTGRVESGFPERVLNLCAEYGVRFWDLRWESAAAFTFTLTRRDWKRLRRLTARLDCDLTAVRWRGTPFFLAAPPVWAVDHLRTVRPGPVPGLILHLGY